MATKKITIEVEVPEGAVIERERLERVARAIIFEITSQDLAKLLGPDDKEIEEVIKKTRRGLQSPHP